MKLLRVTLALYMGVLLAIGENNYSRYPHITMLVKRVYHHVIDVPNLGPLMHGLYMRVKELDDDSNEYSAIDIKLQHADIDKNLDVLADYLIYYRAFFNAHFMFANKIFASIARDYEGVLTSNFFLFLSHIQLDPKLLVIKAAYMVKLMQLFIFNKNEPTSKTLTYLQRCFFVTITYNEVNDQQKLNQILIKNNVVPTKNLMDEFNLMVRIVKFVVLTIRQVRLMGHTRASIEMSSDSVLKDYKEVIDWYNSILQEIKTSEKSNTLAQRNTFGTHFSSVRNSLTNYYNEVLLVLPVNSPEATRAALYDSYHLAWMHVNRVEWALNELQEQLQRVCAVLPTTAVAHELRTNTVQLKSLTTRLIEEHKWACDALDIDQKEIDKYNILDLFKHSYENSAVPLILKIKNYFDESDAEIIMLIDAEVAALKASPDAKKNLLVLSPYDKDASNANSHKASVVDSHEFKAGGKKDRFKDDDSNASSDKKKLSKNLWVILIACVGGTAVVLCFAVYVLALSRLKVKTAEETYIKSLQSKV